MKHLLLVEHEPNLDSFISEFTTVEDRFCLFSCKFDELESLACNEEFDGGIIVLVPTWREIKLEVLREKFPRKKIMLLSAMISDVTVRELQHDKGVIDLFFKAPIPMEKIDSMYDAFNSAQTASVNIGIDDDDSLVLEGAFRDTQALEMSEDDGDLELDGADEDTSLEMDQPSEIKVAEEVTRASTSVIDLAKELEGEVLGGNNVTPEGAKGNDLMTLLEGEGEYDHSTHYDSHDISRILKTDVLQEELRKEAEAQASEKTVETSEVEENILIPEFADPSLLVGGSSQERGVDLSLLSNSEISEEEVKSKKAEGASPDEVQKMLRHREEDYLKLLTRNEILEEENRIIREKIISLEEVASSASLISKKKSLESDENKIKISVLRRHHNEELEKIHGQNKLYREKLGYLKESMDRLVDENKKLLKQNMIDVKKVRSREEELEEKLNLMKADVSSQIKNRENKIIELKRKIDLLHFDLKDSEEREKELSHKITILEEKLYKLKKVLGESIERLDDSFYDEPARKVKL